MNPQLHQKGGYGKSMANKTKWFTLPQGLTPRTVCERRNGLRLKGARHRNTKILFEKTFMHTAEKDQAVGLVI